MGSGPVPHGRGPVILADRPSPNFGPRRDGMTPRLIVLHYTAMAQAQAAIDWLCTPASQVSAHYLVDRDGRITRMVADIHRAWHAGQGAWTGCADVNSASLGIELVNTGSEPFPAPQMTALEHLLDRLMTAHAIPPAGIIAHSDLAPLRKSDPGPRFDWRRLARAGRAVWPRPTPACPADMPCFRRALGAFGYPNVPDDALLRAFRLRFRPQATGPLDSADMALALGLPPAAPLFV